MCYLWLLSTILTGLQAHGKTVADAKPYLPGFFDCAPRNPAEKINSGYKAIEYIGYFYVLGPALLHNILPRPYYRHFCMLVCAIRILHQCSISQDDLRRAHWLCMTFVRDYEVLYYGRRTARSLLQRSLEWILCSWDKVQLRTSRIDFV